MITKELIEKAREERKRKLRNGSIIIMSLGLVVTLIGLARVFIVQGIADHVLFMFGSLVTAFGIFAHERNN
jgi:hypothetical protein